MNIITDKNGFLTVGVIQETGKQYTRSFLGYPYTDYDHTVLVFHKNQIIEKQLKDIGAGECVIMQNAIFEYNEKPHPGHSRLGFDLLYKVDEETGEPKNIARVDSIVLPVAEKLFGTSRTALVSPSYESSMSSENIVSFLFGIALAHGKRQIKDNTLMPIKITLPLTSSLFGKREIFDILAKNLHALHYLHTLQYVQSASYEIVQLTMHDVNLLQQFVLWMKTIVNIDKISTHEKRQKIYDILTQYAGSKAPLPTVETLSILTCD